MNNSDEMKPEYDFSGGGRGKHHQAYQQGTTTIVTLDSDVATHFKDAEAVNHALRMLIRLAAQEVPHTSGR